MKRTVKTILCSLFLTLCIGMAVSATEEESSAILIGVAVYNPDDAQTRAFRSYYEDYLGEAFNVEFRYSGSLTSWDDEKNFVDALHEEGASAIISSQSLDREAVVKLCQEYGMYYIFGSSSLSQEVFDTLKAYPSFLGTVGASDESEAQAGTGMAEYFASDDEALSHSYLICTGGAGLGNEMHRIRGLAMLNGLADCYGLAYDLPAEELVESAGITEAANDKGVKIVILPGYPYVGTMEESTGQLLKEHSIDTVMSTMVINSQMDEIRAAEKALGIDIRVGSVDCFTEEAYEYFNGVGNGGKPELDYLVGRYGACVAPAFAAVYNAATGYAENFRDNGSAFRLNQSFWTASSTEEFNEQYAMSIGIYENTYSAVDIMQVLKDFNPDADFEDFRAFAER